MVWESPLSGLPLLWESCPCDLGNSDPEAWGVPPRLGVFRALSSAIYVHKLLSTITLTGGLLVLSVPLASLWGLEVTLAGPGLGAFTAGTEESTRDGRMGEGLRMEGRPPYTFQPAGTQSQSQTQWMCVCLWIADASKRPTLEFPLKLLGHSIE